MLKVEAVEQRKPRRRVIQRCTQSLIPVVALLALAACAGGPGGEPGADDEERHHIPEAGTHVVVPDGWVADTEDLLFGEVSVQPDVSAMEADEAPMAIVLVGRFDGLFVGPESGSLQDVATSNAASFAEFLFPEPGERTTLVDEEREIDGNPARVVEFEITQGETLTYSRFLVVDRQNDDPVFAYFAHTETPDDLVEEGNHVLDSLSFD
ncbi:hypothetical protein J4H86_11970 [Spiractinospora alimapuensis]|uniref:alanine and proline-rich secreted protein Apa n=1 Tax=Spiractinospora alimapuensis TaxID=2820884 RepID=UPI001F17BE03|nr:alanine and proline-rich secreted protein Apa [Spiractinospora alimapuensis]QVQ54329.1 hypothetical protein J4H86_11970 [Spiractinospora alimapuensis]